MADGRSTPELFGEVLARATHLFRTEIRLVRTEIGEKVTQAITGVVLALVGAILLLAAIFVLLGAAVDWVASFGLSRYLAGLIVGGIIALIGAVLVFSASRNLKGENLIPRRSLNQLNLRGRPAGVGERKVT